MATNFKCPRCKKIVKVGRLRSSYTCPLCGKTMVLSKHEKNQGYADYKVNFFALAQREEHDF